MIWALGLTVVILALLMAEAALLRRAVDAVPCRVLVSGTRGKSGLVRVLSAGLRTVEPATWGKITGDVASRVAPDGTLRALRRHGPPHLREQARLVLDGRRNGVRCLVVESMAITPEAMAAEARLMRPTLMIVTNVRDDHRETLGGDPDGQRAAYLSSIPAGCRWLTRDEEFARFARRSGRHLEPVCPPPPAAAPDDPGDLDVPAELIATAAAAMEALGWNPEPARHAMQAAAADLRPPTRVVSLLGRRMTLLDAFSANEPESLTRLWTQWRRNTGATAGWSVLFNTRADRPLRTRQFCGWLAGRADVDRVYLAGSHVPVAARLLKAAGRSVERVPRGEPFVLAGAGHAAAGPGARDVIVGMGNASGLGLSLRAGAAGSGPP